MKKDNVTKPDWKLIIISGILQIAVTVVFISLFAAVMYFLEVNNKYSPIFGSVAVALGTFASSYFVSSKRKNKGYLNGIIIGSITFVLITLIGLIINGGGVTVNTLFHMIIIILSAVVGGILGVNSHSNFIKGKF